MCSLYHPPQQRKSMVATGILVGFGVSAVLFLAIPLTQIFTEYKKAPEEIDALEIAPPPPPPPPEEPPPPPEPEEEEPPPELNTPPPPISLDQIDMALNPGTGGSLAGDFALPTFEVGAKDLGGLEIFDLDEVDSPPRPRTSLKFSYPAQAKRKGITGVVKFEYIVTRDGRVDKLLINSSPSPILSKAITDVMKNARFEPSTIQGRPVAVKMTGNIPFN